MVRRNKGNHDDSEDESSGPDQRTRGGKNSFRLVLPSMHSNPLPEEQCNLPGCDKKHSIHRTNGGD